MVRRGKNDDEKIVALFPAVDAAERAIVELKRLGIRNEDMSVSLPEPLKESEVEAQTGVRQIDQPQIGLAGVRSSVGLGSSVVDTLEDLGFARDTAKTYANRIDAGGVLLAIKCGSLCERERTAIDKFGAFDVRTASPRTADYGGSGFRPGPLRETGDQDFHEDRFRS
jgi:hypothetical protein